MRIIVAGPRNLEHDKALREVNLALAYCPWADAITEIVHGDQRGVDRAAAEIARGIGAKITPFPADWARHGKMAGPIRNDAMAHYANEENDGALVAVWDGKTRGTGSMVRIALSYYLLTFVWPVRWD